MPEIELTADESRAVARLLSSPQGARAAAEWDNLAAFLGRVVALSATLTGERHALAPALAGWLKEIEPILAALVAVPSASGGRGPALRL